MKEFKVSVLKANVLIAMYRNGYTFRKNHGILIKRCWLENRKGDVVEIKVDKHCYDFLSKNDLLKRIGYDKEGERHILSRIGKKLAEEITIRFGEKPQESMTVNIGVSPY